MCDRPSFVTPEQKAIGTFRKDNLPEGTSYTFQVIVKPCACGANLVARTPEGNVWVEAEPEITLEEI